MALRIELKPGERVVLGDCLITNTGQRTRLLIDGNAPILREKDIISAGRADSPAKGIYFIIQLMYVANDPDAYQDLYFGLVSAVLAAAPSTLPYIASINAEILVGDLYKALKAAAKLIEYETELLGPASAGDPGDARQVGYRGR